MDWMKMLGGWDFGRLLDVFELEPDGDLDQSTSIRFLAAEFETPGSCELTGRVVKQFMAG